jgi:hypothetical protein
MRPESLWRTSLRSIRALAALCLLLAGGPALGEEKKPASYLIESTKGASFTAKQLAAKSESGWLLGGVVRADAKANTYLWYFVRSPLGKKKVEFEVVAEKADYKDAGPLNKDRGNKGWQLVGVLNLGDGKKPGPYRYFFAKLGGTHAHGILTAKDLVSPEALDKQWGKLGFRLAGLVPSSSQPNSFKYYIVLPDGKQAAQEHRAVSTKKPPKDTKELDTFAKDGWRLVCILPTADKDQPFIFWLNRPARTG